MKAVVVLIGLLISLSAHPHIFIKTAFDINKKADGSLSVKVIWAFDPMTSMGFIEEFDANQDGRLDKTEVQNVYKNAFETLKSYDYFHVIEVNNKKLTQTQVRNFHASITDEASLLFTFEFANKLQVDAKTKVRISAFDPESFVYMELEAEGLSVHPNVAIKTLLDEPSQSAYYGKYLTLLTK